MNDRFRLGSGHRWLPFIMRDRVADRTSYKREECVGVLRETIDWWSYSFEVWENASPMEAAP
jgi:hypothetical protein